jgi:hypothetical protein
VSNAGFGGYVGGANAAVDATVMATEPIRSAITMAGTDGVASARRTRRAAMRVFSAATTSATRVSLMPACCAWATAAATRASARLEIDDVWRVASSEAHPGPATARA